MRGDGTAQKLLSSKKQHAGVRDRAASGHEAHRFKEGCIAKRRQFVAA